MIVDAFTMAGIVIAVLVLVVIAACMVRSCDSAEEATVYRSCGYLRRVFCSWKSRRQSSSEA